VAVARAGATFLAATVALAAVARTALATLAAVVLAGVALAVPFEDGASLSAGPSFFADIAFFTAISWPLQSGSGSSARTRTGGVRIWPSSPRLNGETPAGARLVPGEAPTKVRQRGASTTNVDTPFVCERCFSGQARWPSLSSCCWPPSFGPLLPPSPAASSTPVCSSSSNWVSR